MTIFFLLECAGKESCVSIRVAIIYIEDAMIDNIKTGDAVSGFSHVFVGLFSHCITTVVSS
jgi:hypothetical protein